MERLALARAGFDKLVVAARVELDAAKRKAMYAEAQHMIADTGGMVCYAVGDYLDGYSKKVKGVSPIPGTTWMTSAPPRRPGSPDGMAVPQSWRSRARRRSRRRDGRDHRGRDEDAAAGQAVALTLPSTVIRKALS